MPKISSIAFEIVIALAVAALTGWMARAWLGDTTGLGYAIGLLLGVIIVLMWYRPARAKRRHRENARLR
jgi:4-amino-4-deoxy-L-arabinose transferase-like glycosyltransferase